jgi:hypothetical protein
MNNLVLSLQRRGVQTMESNKKQRTIDGRPAAAVPATPLVDSVAPALAFRPTGDNWGDGMKWEEMDHDTKLRFLTPRYSETGHPDRQEIGFYDYLPQAVKNPLSNDRVARMEDAKNVAIKDIRAFFKGAKEEQEEGEKNEKDDDESSDGYPSSDDAMTTKTFKWNEKITEEGALQFVTMLPKHLTFTASFDADAGNALQAKRCYCPCSKKSQQWHQVAGVEVERVVSNMGFECKSVFYGARGLLDHLRGKHDPLHHGVLAYVNELYPNYKKA